MCRKFRKSTLLLFLLLIPVNLSIGCANKINQPVEKPIEPVSTLTIQQETWPVYNTVIWKYKKKNPCSSTPLSFNDIVYTENYKDIVALNRKTGKVLWTHNTHYCESNIIIAENKLIFGSNDTHVYALDAKTGRMVWKFNTGYIVHMVNSAQDKVLVGGEGPYLYALDLKTGKSAWQIDLKVSCEFNSFIDNESIYFGTDNKNLYSIQISTGKINWLVKTEKVVRNSSVWNNLIYFAQCGYQPYEIPGFEKVFFLIALDVVNAKEAWRFNIGGCVNDYPIIYQNHVIFHSEDGYLYSLDAQTGQCKWKKYLGLDHNVSGPVLYNDTLFLGGGSDGRLYVLDAHDGSPKWVFDDIQNNQPLRDNLKSIYTGKPHIIDSTVYFETDAGYLYAIPIVDESKIINNTTKPDSAYPTG